MKHNWEYKRLGEICDILDSQRRPVTKSDRKPGPYPYYGASGVQDYVSDYIFDGDYLLVGEDGAKWGANEKSAFSISGKTWVNNHAHILDFKKSPVSQKFVEYILCGSDLNKIITGTVVPKLTQKNLISVLIPVPPREVQERIVAELDKINETIEDCRELLRNLDALAQSLFYDFFGDPAINPKGWRIYKIKDICSVNPTKREIRIPTSSEISFLPMEDLPINARYFTPIKVKTLNEVQNSYTYFSGEDVLFAKVTPCFENGKAGIPVNLINNIGFGSSELFVLRPNFQIINREYIYSFIRTNHFVSEAIKKLSGTSGLRRVPRTVVENFQIPVPPLELQEKFAARMEEIEAQKKTVESTIAELQTLLDSRMDYWFN